MNRPQFTVYQQAQARWENASMTNNSLGAFAAYQLGKGLADTTVRNRESILRTL